MAGAPIPFRADRYDLAVDGLFLSPVAIDEAASLGAAQAAIDPWARYGIPAEAQARGFLPAADGYIRMAVRKRDGRTIVGAIVVRPTWLLGPYLQSLVVLPGAQGRGIGRALLAWLEGEARAAKARNLWVCVSAFNERAQKVYQQFGFSPVATLDDLIATGLDEILMRKRLYISPSGS